MSKLHEIIDSLNNENVEELKETLKSEASVQMKENSQLYQRAKKAEGFEFDKDTKQWVKKEIKSKAEPAELKNENKISNEPDYAKLAYLKSEGINHPDDQKLVQDEANRLKLPLTDILRMAHIKSQLLTANDQRAAQAGMPKGRGSGGGGKTQQDVDYWLDRKNADGTYETPSDSVLAEKVINARIQKEEQGHKFSDKLYS